MTESPSDVDVLIRLLLRFILVPLGGAVALAVAATVIVIGHHDAIATLLQAPPEAQADWLLNLAVFGPLLAVLLSILAFHVLVPAAIGVVISEVLAVRSWIYHGANGALAAAVGWGLTRDLAEEYRILTEPKILIAAGLIAGLAYWAVAGWTAGFWKPAGRNRALLPDARVR